MFCFEFDETSHGLIVSAKEVMFMPWLVYLLVCLCVCQQDYLKRYGFMFMKFNKTMVWIFGLIWIPILEICFYFI